MIARIDTHQVFDQQGNVVVEQIVETDVTAEVVQLDLHVKARQALDANAAFLADDAVTNADAIAQVKATTRQINAIIRLLLAGDLLTESEDT